jgi:hypothetical protein
MIPALFSPSGVTQGVRAAKVGRDVAVKHLLGHISKNIEGLNET